jgi:Ethanolamine utilization protein EutJ (predicted chaperonin)
MLKGTSKAEKKQDSRELEEQCWKFLQPLLEQMHELVDRRIVKTLLDLVMVILIHRHRNNG